VFTSSVPGVKIDLPEIAANMDLKPTDQEDVENADQLRTDSTLNEELEILRRENEAVKVSQC